uniref:Uncharacterized protein n=1 Tax=Pseudomonas putida TaxID=303 RepID=A0A1W6QXW6_PSEPU|nr:Hypothetical protein [Pseudomonas putida]
MSAAEWPKEHLQRAQFGIAICPRASAEWAHVASGRVAQALLCRRTGGLRFATACRRGAQLLNLLDGFRHQGRFSPLACSNSLNRSVAPALGPYGG